MNNYWETIRKTSHTRRRLLAGTAGAGLGAALLAACGGGQKHEQPASGLVVPVTDESKNAVKGGTLKLFHAYDQQSFDPHFTSLPNFLLTNMVYSDFFHYPGGYKERTKGVLDGDLASSWEFSPDNLQLTMKFTDKAHFAPVPPTNGRAVSVEDVLFSWERFKSIATRRIDYANDVNPEAPIVSLTAPDSRTIVMKFSEPNAVILHFFGYPAAGDFFVVPKESDTPALDLRRTQNGSGPWYLENYSTSSSYTYLRNPGFQQDKLPIPYIDKIEMPIITEYAQLLAQFKAGTIYYTGARAATSLLAEDLLPTKRDLPQLELLPTDLVSANTRNFFGQNPGSPFRDERVRQAWSMSFDRDLFIETIFNVSKFENQGLQMQTAWDSAVPCNTWSGWWLDPKSKDFGETAKYYQHNIAEAKQLLAAAGFQNGVELTAYYPPTGYGAAYVQQIQIILGMVADAGFRPKIEEVSFTGDWRPKFANAAGHFSGTSFIPDTFGEPVQSLYRHYHSNQTLWHGFDPDGKGTYAGDPFLDDLTTRMRREFNEAKRIQMAFELQRYEGKKMYWPRVAGGANSFELAWPVVRNRDVWQGIGHRDFSTWWLDPKKPPLGNA